MEHTPIKSSNIHSIAYDPVGQNLEVRFKGKDGKPGSLYSYECVTAREYAALMASESKGTHFAQHIKAKKAQKVNENASR